MEECYFQQALICNFDKSNTPLWVFLRFLNGPNGFSKAQSNARSLAQVTADHSRQQEPLTSSRIECTLYPPFLTPKGQGAKIENEFGDYVQRRAYSTGRLNSCCVHIITVTLLLLLHIHLTRNDFYNLLRFAGI